MEAQILNLIDKLHILKNKINKKLIEALIKETTIEERKKIIADNIRKFQALEKEQNDIYENEMKPLGKKARTIKMEYYKTYGYYYNTLITLEKDVKPDYEKLVKALKSNFNIDIDISSKNKKKIIKENQKKAVEEIKKIIDNDPRIVELKKEDEILDNRRGKLFTPIYDLKEDTKKLYRSLDL
jgi:hypothetical protein